MNEKQGSTSCATLNSIDAQRRTPFVSDGNMTSRGHAKSSSSIANNMLERLDFDERNNSNSMGRKKRVFDVSILSPTLKNKVDRILSHLSSHTTSHRMENISGVFTTKIVNSQAAQVPPTEASLSIKPVFSNTSRNQTSLKIISTDRAENSHSHSIYKTKVDIENIKVTHHLEQIKGASQKKLALPRNDLFNNLTSLYGRNLTTRSKLSSRTPDTFDFIQTSGLETTKASKNPINSIARQFSALSERRNENNKENKMRI